MRLTRRRRRRRGVLKAREEWQRRLNMITAAAGMDPSAREEGVDINISLCDTQQIANPKARPRLKPGLLAL